MTRANGFGGTGATCTLASVLATGFAAVFALGLALGLASAAAGCGDDDVTQQCGNTLIEGTEQCDGTELGSNTCTTILGGFTGGTLTCNPACRFDTSGCSTAQPRCGDGVIDAGEDCDGTALDGQTCADVGNYIGGALACTVGCAWDRSGCEVPPACGDAVIDAGEDCDGSNLGGLTCAEVGNYNTGTLACAGDCTWDESGCEYQLSPSEQINVVRMVPDATGYTLDVEDVLVTYLKPSLGNDPAGFTVQAAAQGPAVFVRLEPTSLSPIPAPGDAVSFTVHQVGSNQGRREVLSVSGWTVHSSQNLLDPLVQTVSSATDLVTGLDGYEAELITVDGTLVADFGPAGAGHVKALMETDGVLGDPGLLLRLPDTLTASLGLAAGCTFTVARTPLWRLGVEAQVLAYDPAELTVHACPAPRVVSAVATGDATVVLTMDRPMDGASLTDPANQITFTGGLTAAAAAVNEHEITVSTALQTVGATYVVTVAGTVTDTLGTGVDPAADSATFLGWGAAAAELSCNDGVDNDGDGYVDCLDADCAADSACAWGSQLYLWELDADQVSVDATEYVELWNNTGATIDFGVSKHFLLLINGNGDVVYRGVQLTGTLAAGDVYLIGASTVPGVDLVLTPASDAIQNGPDGVLLVRCDTCTTLATDFPNGWMPIYSATPPSYVSANGQPVMWIDALAYETDDADDPALWTALNVTGQHDELGGPNGPADNLQRTSPAGWSVAPPTPGLPGIE